MPNLSSPLGTANTLMPLVRVDALSQAAGFSVVFPTIADMNAAIAVERARIAGGNPMWPDGHSIALASEVAEGVRRAWNASAQHARKALIKPGTAVTLAQDTNVILFGSGVPAAGVGSTGDISVDWPLSTFNLKGVSAWATGGSLGTAAIGLPVLTAVNYAALATDYLIEVDSTAAPVLITFPHLAALGHEYRIAWIAGTNAVTVTTTNTAVCSVEDSDGLSYPLITVSALGEVIDFYRSALRFKRT